MVWLPILLPLVAGPLLWAGGAARARRGGATALGTAATLVTVATLAVAVVAAVGGATGSWAWGAGLTWRLSAGHVAGVAAILVPLVAAPVVAYAASHEPPALLPRLLGLMVAFVGSMELLVLAADLLTLTIAFELVGALSWALIGAEWTDPDNPARAAHAFNATRVAGLALFLAAGATFAATGSLSYGAIASVPRPLLDVVAGAVLVAAASKSAQVPFSPWLYSAMAGPTPVSALLHSATMVAAGAYVVIRLEAPLATTGWFGPAVIAVGLVTAIAGGVVAAMADHGKRLLAASTSAQYGLMFVAAGAGATGIALAHLVAHALFKSLLFLGVGIGMHAVGTADIRRMHLGRDLPVTAVAFGIGALALAAVPPLGGAWTKDAVVAAAMKDQVVDGALTLLAGFLSALYATRLGLLAYGPPHLTGDRARPEVTRDRHVHRPPPVEVVAVGVLAALSLALGALWVPGSAHVVERVTGLMVTEGALWQLALSVTLLVVGAGIVVADLRAGRGASFGLADRHRAAIGEWFGLGTATKTVVVDPFLALARLAARFDDRVVDAGVRGAVAFATFVSRLSSRWAELGIDGAVRAIAGGTLRGADASRVADDRGVDGAVEGLADGVGIAGRRSRSLQTGLAHHYYLIMAIGIAVLAVAVAIWR